MVISVATILNYGLGVAISILTGVPLLLRVYAPQRTSKLIRMPFALAALPLSLIAAFEAIKPYEATVTGAPARAVFWFVLYPLWYQSASSVF